MSKTESIIELFILYGYYMISTRNNLNFSTSTIKYSTRNNYTFSTGTTKYGTCNNFNLCTRKILKLTRILNSSLEDVLNVGT